MMSEVLLHGHHEGLLTWGRGYYERLKQIREDKPPSELPLREARMRVLTEAELAALPAEVSEAARAYDETWRAYEVVGRAYEEAFCNHVSAIEAWHRAVCVPECMATPENQWNIFG